MTDEANNQGGEDSNAGKVSELLNTMTAPVPSTASEQSSQNATAGQTQGQDTTPDTKFWGKFNSEDDAKRSYDEAQAELTRAKQQLAEMQRTAAPAQPAQPAPAPAPDPTFLNFQFGQPQNNNRPSDLYPATDELLGRSVDQRLGQFATQVSEQLNPVLAQMTRQINDLQQRLVVADSRSVVASASEEFPELKSDANFRAEVETTMKDMQTKMQLNLSNAQQFDTLLRTAAHAVRGKRGFASNQRIAAETQAAGQTGMRGMATGRGTEHGGAQSEGDLIRQGILQAANTPRSKSIF